MNAIDTNVLVRMLFNDHPEQAALSRALFGDQPIVWIAKTVLLETAWVLRGTYGFTDKAISEAFRELLGISNVQMEDALAVADALSLTTAGLAFADALHLCSRPPDANFITFDRSLVRQAKRAGVAKVSTVGRA